MHIVVVDPSSVVRKILARALDGHIEKISDFADGNEAYQFLLANPDVDIVITSLELSGRSGLELVWDCRLLCDGGRPLYTIAMSATNEERKLAEALDGGADDFINKPPHIVELHARVRAARRALALQTQLIDAAYRDSLTGLSNRRAFYNQLNEAMNDNLAKKTFLAIADIDHFKSINDTHGHDIGDDAIVAVGSVLTALFQDKAARIGGEEFAILLNACSPTEAIKHCDEFRLACADLEIRTPLNGIGLTVSVGLCEVFSGSDQSIAFKSADQALYHAKRGGRNQVHFFDQETAVHKDVA